MRDTERSHTLAQHFHRTYRFFSATLLVCMAITIVGVAIVVGNELPAASEAARAQRSASRSVEAALDQQSSFRAYLLSGDDQFRVHYRTSSDAFIVANRDLADAIEGKHLAMLMIESQRSHERWEALAARYLDQPPSGDDLAGATSRTAPLFDAYRQDADELVDAISVQRVHQARRFFVSVGMPVMAVFATFMTGIVLLRREQRKLQQLVTMPINELENRVRKVAEGEADVDVGAVGVDDFRQLGEGIDGVVRALAEERERVQATIAIAGEESSQLRHLLEFVRVAGSHTSLSELQSFLCEESRRMSGAAGVALIDRLSGGELRVCCTSGDLDLEAHGTNLVERAVMVGRTTKDDTGVVVPLIHAGQVIALLQFTGDSSFMDERLLELIGVQSGSALEVAKVHHEVEYLSEHDPLTGVLNRRRFDADLELELRRAARYGAPATLLMIDVDHFKKINDEHGHHFGDHVLRSTASSLTEVLRATDSAYRYGGEEFAVIARQTDLKNAMPVASRLHQEVQSRVRQITSIDVTVSIGVASVPEVGHSVDSLIGRADAGLYKAKELGRDRIVAARLSEFVEVS